VTAEIRFRSRLSLCGICGRQIGIRVGPSPNNSVFPCHCYATNVPYLYFIHLPHASLRIPRARNFDVQGLKLRLNIPFGATGNFDISWLRNIARSELICALKVP
jgi:hypothetical protein